MKASRQKSRKKALSPETFFVPGKEPLMENAWHMQDHHVLFPTHVDSHIKTEGGRAFRLKAPFLPAGDQERAIDQLIQKREQQNQVLLGVTGSGKTFTMANVIMRTQRSALVMAPNKILAAQLYSEFKHFFPDAAVSYFVSYYDYYQPEAYMPHSDTYIAKEATINEDIDRMRHWATRALLERDDVIIIASVSCLYGLGAIDSYSAMITNLSQGQSLSIPTLCTTLADGRYTRTNLPPERGQFALRGNHMDVFLAHHRDTVIRITFQGNMITSIREVDAKTRETRHKLSSLRIYPNSHYATPMPTLRQAIVTIKEEMEQRVKELKVAQKDAIAARIEERTISDLEHMRSHGSCHGIENYSRHLTGRSAGMPPPSLFEYLPPSSLLFVDESHVAVPQIRAMFRGDFQRKMTLASYGFRLPSCVDNRPLKFEEWDQCRPKTVFVSATPGPWELEKSDHSWVEQMIRPTGLLDPEVSVLPAQEQVSHFLKECAQAIASKEKVLVTTLTRKMAESLVEFLLEQGLRARCIHADVETLERIAIMRDLRQDRFDILVGINLLREGLDVPECALVGIFDADREGFLRSKNALIQTVGRAARHEKGRAILYADRITNAMEEALHEMKRRRDIQKAYNRTHNIRPTGIASTPTITLPTVEDIFGSGGTIKTQKQSAQQSQLSSQEEESLFPQSLSSKSLDDERRHAITVKKRMLKAAKEENFEEAARLRDLLHNPPSSKRLTSKRLTPKRGVS